MRSPFSLRSRSLPRRQRGTGARRTRLECLEDRTLLAAGSLDLSFGLNGVVRTDFVGSHTDQATDVAVRQSDGKIIVAGYTSANTTDFALTRYNADGSTDTSFGPNANGTLTDVSLGTIQGLALDGSGNVVVAGGSSIVRYTPGGIRDTSFGSGGRISVSNLSSIQGVTIDASNRVVVAGFRFNAVNGTSRDDFAVSRYNTNGTLDVNFTAVDFGGTNDDAQALAIDSQGRVVVAGYSQNPGNGSLTDVAVARYNTNGTLDTSFGSGGKATVDFNGDFDAAGAVAIDAFDNIVVGGSARTSNNDRVGLARLAAADGSLDAGFGTAGKFVDTQVFTTFSSFDLALDGAGKIVVGTQTSLLRYLAAGGRDSTFAIQGAVSTSNLVNQISGVAIQADGGILVAGNFNDGGTSGQNFSVARFSATGVLDTSFGSPRGFLASDFVGSRADQVNDLVVRQSDGKIIAAGYTSVTSTDFALVRYNANGSIDNTFGPNGNGKITEVGFGIIESLALDGNGNIVVGGGSSIIRYTPGGIRDTSFGGSGVVNVGGNVGNVRSLTIDASNRVVVAGYRSNAVSTSSRDDFTAARYNANGTLDVNFTSVDFGGTYDDAIAIAIDGLGRLAVVGYTQNPSNGSLTDFAVVRYTTAGTLDTTFGVGGKATIDFSGDFDAAGAVAIDAANNIIVGGAARINSNDWVALARLSATDGSLDAAFGVAGKSADIQASSGYLNFDMALDGAGRIVVGTQTNLLRYMSAGGRDSTFGSQGEVSTSGLVNQITGVAIQADGKILVGGYYGSGSATGIDFAVTRYSATGALDTSFGSPRGFLNTDFVGSRSDQANDLVVRQSDGKIIAAGYTSATNTDFALVRYNANGSIDNTFGPNGNGKITDVGLGTIQSLALDSNGNIVVAGGSSIVRYTPGGLRDATFGNGGLVNVSTYSDIQGVAIDSLGRVVVAGYRFNAVSGSSLYDFAAARYNVNGTLDVDFAPVDFGGTYDLPQAIAIDGLGRLVVVGYAQNPNNGSLTDFAVVRYTTAGALDTSFGSGGKRTIDFGGGFDAAGGVSIDAANNVIVGGSAQISGVDRVGVARLTATNGSLDPTFGATGKFTDPSNSSAYYSFDMALDGAGKIVVGTQSNLARYTTAGVRDLLVSTGSTMSQISGVAIQADGKILVGGYRSTGGNTGYDFVINRYNGASLDGAFGSGGSVTTDFVGSRSDQANDLVVRQSDGKIIVAGYTSATNTDFALVRYNADGSIDNAFGTNSNGKITEVGFGIIESLALDGNGNIVVGGGSSIIRYTPGGLRDTSFGGSGVVNVGGNVGNVQGVTVDAGNRVVVAGYRFNAVNGSSLYDFTAARYNVNGSLDANFTSVDFGTTYDFPSAIAIDGLGRLVVVGYVQNPNNGSLTDFAVVRYTTAGALDTTFGTGGKATLDFGGDSDVAGGLAIDAANNIFVGGSARINNGDRVALARLTAGNGSLDASFGAAGKFVDLQSSASGGSFELALDGAGRIIVGTLSNLLRYTSAGGRDLTFGIGGAVSTGDALSQVLGVAIQVDGRILVSGYYYSSDATGYDFAVARYSAAGVLDGSFGAAGTVTTDFVGSRSDQANDLVVRQSDGKIIVAGYTSATSTDFALIRYNADGSIDNAFGPNGNGKITEVGLGAIQSLTLDGNGNVVVASGSSIVRYTPTGLRDTSFGSGGLVSVSNVGIIQGVTVDASNRVVVAGYRSNAVSASSREDFTAARYNANGTLDVNFTSVDFGGGSDVSWALALDGLGRLVVVGYTQNPSNGSLTDFAVVRYTTAGTLDTTFGVGGKATIDFNGDFDAAGAVAIDAANNIVVGGAARTSGSDRLGLARLTAANGSLDASFGAAGKSVDTQIFGAYSSMDLALDGAGRIVVGTQTNLLRYTSAGARDTGFGSQGLVFTSGLLNQITGVAIQSDGNILVGGYFFTGGTAGYDFSVARYLGNNRPPTAANDTATTNEDTAVTVSVRSNDTDPDGDVLTISSVSTTGTLGLVTINTASGTVTYNPNGAFDSLSNGQTATDTFTYQVSDGFGGTATATVTVTVTGINDAPVLSGVPSGVTINEQTLYTFTASAIDVDSSSLTFSLSGAPSGASIDAATGVFSWTPAENQGGDTYSFSVRVSDGIVTTSQVIAITVAEVNVVPVLGVIGDKSVNEQATLSFTASATDQDLPAQALSYSLDAAAIALGMSIDATTGAFSWTPTEAQGGASYTATITVSDNGAPALSASETVTITVAEVNAAPVLDTLGDKSVDEQATLSFSASATDQDAPAQTLSYSLDAAAIALGMSINPATGAFAWTPTEAQGGASYTATITVTDNGVNPSNLSDSETITITVAEVNVAPVLGAIGNKSVNEQAPLAFMASATDQDAPAQALSYSLDAAAIALGMSINPTTGAFSWTPTEAQGGASYTATITVTDNGANPSNLTDSEAITIAVAEVNVAPVLGAIGNKSVNEQAPLSFTVGATDQDAPAQALSYSLDAAAIALGMSINPVTGTFSWTPTEAQGGASYAVTITVTDNGAPALSDSETITIAVAEVNVAPVLGAIGNKSVDEQATLSFMTSATDQDAPAQALSYSLDAAAIALGMSINPATGAFSWAPTEAQNGTYTVTFTVKDNGTPALSDSETITITVAEVNAAPVLGAIGNRATNEGAALSFTILGSDSDTGPGAKNTLNYSAVGLPAGATLDPVSGAFSWTPGEAQDGTYTVTFTVSDNATPALSASETVTITVAEVNAAPVLGSIGNRATNESAALSFTISGSDSDTGPGAKNTLNYSAVGLPAGATLDPVTGAFSWTPGEAQDGTYTVTFTVTDNGTPALSASETITITVNEVNAAPVLGAIGNKSVDEHSSLSFTASATDQDLPAQTLSYSLDAAALALGMSINPATGAFAWTPTEAQGGASYAVTITVTDNGANPSNLSDSETILISVPEVNAAPTGTDTTVVTDEDATYTFAAADFGFTDPNDDPSNHLLAVTITTLPAAAKGVLQLNGVNVTAGQSVSKTDIDAARLKFVPAMNANGNATFSFQVQDDGGLVGANAADLDPSANTLTVDVRNRVDVSGRVFNDLNNDGHFNGSDVGRGGVTVQVWDQSLNMLVGSAMTAADGTYFLNANLGSGTFRVVEVVDEMADLGLLDGKETAGNLGGTVNNGQAGNTIADLVVGPAGTTADAVDYLFAEIEPSSLFGLVWKDFNNDGEVNFGEQAAPNVTVTLTGKDDRGNSVNLSAISDGQGVYTFSYLRPSNAAGYTITETQPAGLADGRESLGIVNGVAVGQTSGNDQFTGVVMTQPGSSAQNYNFGERPTDGGSLAGGQTATIGFWQNKIGQSLIKAVNGGPDSTQLGDWLAGTLPNLYGASAGPNNLAGKTNAEVAVFYSALFQRNGKTAADAGPPKVDAQVLATALAVYVTNSTLAGTVASSYGFTVSANGAGTQMFNVGSGGGAFGVSNNASLSLLNLLLAVNDRAVVGLLYGGVLDGSVRKAFRTIANDVFTAINERGNL